jgi:hypothetical protein
MTREQAISAAKSDVGYGRSSSQDRAGNWRWRKYGWDILHSDGGMLISCIDEWKSLAGAA